MKKRSLHFLYFICFLVFSVESCNSENKEETTLIKTDNSGDEYATHSIEIDTIDPDF